MQQHLEAELNVAEEVGCKSPYNCEWWKGADFKLGSSSTAMQCNVVQMECKTAKDFNLGFSATALQDYKGILNTEAQLPKDFKL